MGASSNSNPVVSDKHQNWSIRHDKKYCLAIANLLDDPTAIINCVEIVRLNHSTGVIRVDPNLSFDHPYPHQGRFLPQQGLPACRSPCHLQRPASNGSSRVELRSSLNGNENNDFYWPLTSFTWNEAEPKSISTSTIDTTCTI
ncbi:WD repeat-containing protein LWD1-like [Syzygium oleosum]|uniref:WD repeat-containing protein LWD1-like n=1 Tax=Syzygium oleosum TaxID=219896 RepID=UPI0024B93ECD|nr:WD repeat-containing protein LWD1-like [Syzygium oleosum]